MSLTIHKSSAGSGKTYTLAKEYLKLALRSDDYYRQILAVTFTNRAAEEMKERVLQFLLGISTGTHELIPSLSREMEKPEHEIIDQAKRTISHLLHHYSFFNITTIDTFFHRVIRSFSREIGLHGNFGIELDGDKVAEFISSDIYSGVEDNPQLKEWLIEQSMSRLGDGLGYESHGQVSELAKQLFSEEFKRLPQGQFEDAESKERIRSLKQALQEQKKSFEEHLLQMGQTFFHELSEGGIDPGELKGNQTLPNFFKRLEGIKSMSGSEFGRIINKTVEGARLDASDWVAKTSPRRMEIMAFAQDKLMPLMNEAVKFIKANEQNYLTAKVILQNLFTLGLITDLSHRLQSYKREEDLIMISDLPDFLSQIINDSDTPFVYEKIGNRYKHFMIDEFQDTSRFQWKNFKPLLEESLANGNENIIVGDAKQSIYGFRGGEPSLLIEDLQKDIPVAKEAISQHTNWRSAPQVVEFNNHLFDNLPGLLTDLMSDELSDNEINRIVGAYDAVHQEAAQKNTSKDGLVQLEFLDIEKGEKWDIRAMNRLIEVIEDLLTQGHELNDMAILVRYNREAAKIVDHILEYKRTHDSEIEVISAEGMLLSNSQVVQLLINTLKHLLVPNDGTLLSNVVFLYQKVGNHDFTNHQDFVDLNESALPAEFRKHRDHLFHLPILELVEVLIRIFQLNKITQEITYLQAFQDAVLEFSKNNRSDIRVFLDWWQDEEQRRSVQLTGALNAVEIITSHKAKGLQYPIVLVPFCTFKMDVKSHHSWYRSPDGESFDSLKTLPIDYKSELKKTRFASNYQEELAKWYLESLNVLYVAFTRAENGLIAFCDPPPKEKKNMYTTVSKLLWSYFERHQPNGWNPDSRYYRKGNLPVNHHREADKLTSLSSYPTYKWSKKLTVRKTGKAYYDDESLKQRNEGTLLHQILSEIIHLNQTDSVLDRYERRMEITREDRLRYDKILGSLWQIDQVREWFSGDHEVKTEVVVLPAQGETKRMDRVILDGNTVQVVDFKSGSPRSEDDQQVKEYMDLLKEMGYEVRGFLLYLKTGEIREI